MAANLAVVFAGALAAAVAIDYGVRSIKPAFAAGGTAGTAAPAAGATGGGTVAAGKLNANQQAFASRLQADTGLAPSVVAAWVLAEEPASSPQAPNGANNWLNIGSFDSGSWQGGGATVWAAPESAADATAAFILGHPVNGITPPLYGAAGIRAIAAAAGQGVAAEIAAIQHSGWASSGYPDLPQLVKQVSS